MNPNNLVCRTCLGIISAGKVAHDIDDENGLIRNVRNIREMVMFCVPEMDIYISVGPVICESCLGILVSVYNFKIRCLRVENAIRSYITTNSLMDGSCVNLNNVVRQQIVEALKQKNWPQELINEYVDKHLCTTEAPISRPSLELFQVMTQKFNAPRMLSNSGPRPPMGNLFEAPLPAICTAGIAPAAVGTTHMAAIMSPSPSTGGYISVSRNLMPSRPEFPNSPQHLRNVSSSSAPVLPSGMPPSTGPAPSDIIDFQNAFLSTLQLTTTAHGGRQEAVLVKKNEKRKRLPRKAQASRKVSTQNYIPAVFQKGASTFSSALRDALITNPAPSDSIPRVLSSSTGILREESEVVKETELRNVREGDGPQKKVGADVSNDDDVIILDDDTEMTTPRVGNEHLLMNFKEKDRSVAVGHVQGAKAIKKTSSGSAGKPDFNKKIVVKLPMIDREMLKRKLTPEDVIDEIQSKRRRLVVKLSSKLPYLHKNKKVVVQVQRNRFFSCLFCRFSTIGEAKLKEHYLSHHKVCSLCNFKCQRASVMTQHINAMHRSDLEEALKKCEEKKQEFLCYLCNFSGLSDFDLREHRMRIHVKCDVTGMYKCPYLACAKELAIAHTLITHIEKVHDKQKRMECSLCNYVSPSVYYLKQHIQSHSLTRMKCQHCDYRCRTSFSLKIHMQNKHPDRADWSTVGMVYSTEMDDPSNDNYRITLDTLQSRTSESPQNTSKSNDECHTERTLDQYEFAMPSLSEMLCDQTITEEPSDQEDDCLVVSDIVTESQKKTGKGRPASKKKTVILNKKKKKSPQTVVDDPEDCMIVIQEIPTVDLSDDEDAEPNEDGGKSNSEEVLGSPIIEIEDRNDNEDCVVVSKDVAVGTEDSARESRENDVESNPLRGDNDTDVVSETSDGDLNQKTQTESVENTTDERVGLEQSNPELDELKSTTEVQNDTAKENTVEKEDNTVESADTPKNLQTGSELTTEEKELANKENKEVEESSEIAASTANKSRSCSPQNTDQESVSDQSKASNIQGRKDVENEKAAHLEKSDQNSSSSDNESIDSNSSKDSQESRKSIVPDPAFSESVVIDSSDDDSNDCTFVSVTSASENLDQQNKETSNEDDGKDLEAVENHVIKEKDTSESLKDNINKENSDKSQDEIDINDKSDTVVTDQASGQSSDSSKDGDSSNDCTFVNETDAKGIVNKESMELVKEEDSTNESGISEALESSGSKDNPEQSQKELDVCDKSDIVAVDKASDEILKKSKECSNDDNSSDCVFVPEVDLDTPRISQENLLSSNIDDITDGENKETGIKNDRQDLDIVERETTNQKGFSEELEGGSSTNSEESQQILVVPDNTDATATDKASDVIVKEIVESNKEKLADDNKPTEASVSNDPVNSADSKLEGDSMLEQKNLDIEVSKEKSIGLVVVNESELLDTDSEMESSAVDQPATETDISNTNSEVDEPENSEMRRKISESVSDSLSTGEALKENENIADIEPKDSNTESINNESVQDNGESIEPMDVDSELLSNEEAAEQGLKDDSSSTDLDSRGITQEDVSNPLEEANENVEGSYNGGEGENSAKSSDANEDISVEVDLALHPPESENELDTDIVVPDDSKHTLDTLEVDLAVHPPESENELDTDIVVPDDSKHTLDTLEVDLAVHPPESENELDTDIVVPDDSKHTPDTLETKNRGGKDASEKVNATTPASESI